MPAGKRLTCDAHQTAAPTLENAVVMESFNVEEKKTHLPSITVKDAAGNVVTQIPHTPGPGIAKDVAADIMKAAGF